VDLGVGLAVTRRQPGGEYTPADGTALAAAHVTSLTALLLAHHDRLRAILTPPHTQGRAEHVISLLRASCRPVPVADPARTGAGLPDAPTALALATSVWPAMTVPAAGSATPVFAK
jgi:hypothetical protein